MQTVQWEHYPRVAQNTLTPTFIEELAQVRKNPSTVVRQRYMKLNREELADQLLAVEQQYAELHERYLGMNDKLLEWQLRAEQAEAQLKNKETSL